MIIIINAPYSSVNFSVFVTEVLELRTFLFDLHVLISIASVQTPPPLKKKKEQSGREPGLSNFFPGERASVHWLLLGTLRCHAGYDNENVKKAIG